MDTSYLQDLLHKFMCINAPSGYECDMAYALKDHFATFHQNVQIDRIGNVIVTIPGTVSNVPSTMIFGHMDQIGLITRKIEDDGYLRVERLGGVPEKILPGLQVEVLGASGQWIPGVIGAKSHHVTSPEEKHKADRLETISVDIGATNKAQVRANGIDVGSPIVYAPSCVNLLHNLISGTSIDNRGACAILGDLARRLANCPPRGTVYLVGTVWEEYNLRGAFMAAQKVKPDIAISLDVTLSGDTPDMLKQFDTILGAGPVLSMYSFHGRGTLNGVIPHKGLVELIAETARNVKIPLQRFASTGLLTDSSYVQLENEGIACADLAFATRYTHTPVETCSLSDLQQLSDLLCAVLSNLSPEFSLNRY